MKTNNKCEFSNKIKAHFKSKWWIYIVFLMLFLPILLYMMNFRDQEISDKTSDWGDFGSYIGGWYSLITAIAAIMVTIIISRRSSKESRIIHCVEKITLSYERIRDWNLIIEENGDLDTCSKYRKLIKTECIVMIYYVKTFPININNYGDFISSITDAHNDVTNNYRFKVLTNQYETFIKGLPLKIS